jgi:hypothetical protein
LTAFSTAACPKTICLVEGDPGSAHRARFAKNIVLEETALHPGRSNYDEAYLMANKKVREKRNDPRTAETELTAPLSEDIENRYGVSSKQGKRSSAQKMESTRHNFDTIPAARKPGSASGSSDRHK